MIISHLPQLMVKSSPSEQVTSTTTNHPFLQPALPKRNQSHSKIGSKIISKDLNIIVESEDFGDDILNNLNAGEESPILEEHEHEVIE